MDTDTGTDADRTCSPLLSLSLTADAAAVAVFEPETRPTVRNAGKMPAPIEVKSWRKVVAGSLNCASVHGDG